MRHFLVLSVDAPCPRLGLQWPPDTSDSTFASVTEQRALGTGHSLLLVSVCDVYTG